MNVCSLPSRSGFYDCLSYKFFDQIHVLCDSCTSYHMWGCLEKQKFLKHNVFKWNVLLFCRERSMQQTYEALCCEVTRLHSELKHQTGLIRKLRPLISETRLGKAHSGLCHCWWIYWCLIQIILTFYSVYVSVYCMWLPTSTAPLLPFHTSSAPVYTARGASCIPYVPFKQILTGYHRDALSAGLKSFFWSLMSSRLV